MIFPLQNGDASKKWKPTFYDSFGEARNGGRTHQGIDIFAPLGAYLYATVDGTAKQSVDPVKGPWPSNSLGGNYVMLTASDGSGDRHYYAHLSEYVGRGGKVRKGDIIGRVGTTGDAAGTKSHLHYEYHPHGAGAVDPFALLTQATRLDNEPIFWQGVIAIVGLAVIAAGAWFAAKRD